MLASRSRRIAVSVPGSLPTPSELKVCCFGTGKAESGSGSRSLAVASEPEPADARSSLSALAFAIYQPVAIGADIHLRVPSASR